MWRRLVIAGWIVGLLAAGCGQAGQQSAIETAVVGTLTARPAVTLTALAAAQPTLPPRPTAAPATPAPTAPVRRSAPAAAATATASPSTGTSASAQAGCLRWEEAKAHEGETRCVCGPVVQATYAARSNGTPTFLNLGGRVEDDARFTVVIWGEDRPNFDPPPEQAYRGKTICVTGRIRLYRGVAEIHARSPAEISVK